MSRTFPIRGEICWIMRVRATFIGLVPRDRNSGMGCIASQRGERAREPSPSFCLQLDAGRFRWRQPD